MLHSKCLNYGNCSNADKKQTVVLEEGAPLICPECQGRVNLVPLPGTMPWPTFLVIFAVLLVGCFGMLKMLQGQQTAVPSSVNGRVTAPSTAAVADRAAMATDRKANTDAGAATSHMGSNADPGVKPSSAANAGGNGAQATYANPTAATHDGKSAAGNTSATNPHEQPRPQTSEAGWKVPGN